MSFELQYAFNIAGTLKNNHQKIAAVCTDKRGRILSYGVNSYVKSHPLMVYFAKKANDAQEKCFIHAELAAVLKAQNKPIYKISIARMLKTGEPGLAKPCPICSEMLKAFGVQIIEFTTGDPNEVQGYI
jgi:tRNA(Arg) A34 adenosine deaminase TadA